jgi:hypothetical protein
VFTASATVEIVEDGRRRMGVKLTRSEAPLAIATVIAYTTPRLGVPGMGVDVVRLVVVVSLLEMTRLCLVRVHAGSVPEAGMFAQSGVVRGSVGRETAWLVARVLTRIEWGVRPCGGWPRRAVATWSMVGVVQGSAVVRLLVLASVN